MIGRLEVHWTNKVHSSQPFTSILCIQFPKHKKEEDFENSKTFYSLIIITYNVQRFHWKMIQNFPPNLSLCEFLRSF